MKVVAMVECKTTASKRPKEKLLTLLLITHTQDLLDLATPSQTAQWRFYLTLKSSKTPWTSWRQLFNSNQLLWRSMAPNIHSCITWAVSSQMLNVAISWIMESLLSATELRTELSITSSKIPGELTGANKDTSESELSTVKESAEFSKMLGSLKQIEIYSKFEI